MNQPLCTVPVNAKSSFMTVETRSMCSPLGARFDNYLLLLHDQSIYMFRPSFFQKHIYLMLWRYRKKISIWCALAAESLLMDYYSLFNNGMLFPWIVWFIGDSLLKNFLKRGCLNIWWVFCILSGFTAPVLS